MFGKYHQNYYKKGKGIQILLNISYKALASVLANLYSIEIVAAYLS